MRKAIYPVLLLLLAAATASLPSPASAVMQDWNDGNIQWMPYAEGLKAARAAKKPICLVFFTAWCPHCTNYSRMFRDPAVVSKARSFVMIRVDRDRNTELSGKFNLDGQYVPRTYFLAPDGTADAALKAPRDDYKYFYDEGDPGSILAGMERALAKYRN